MTLAHWLTERGYRLRHEGGDNHRVLGHGGLIVKGDRWFWHARGTGGAGLGSLALHLGEDDDTNGPWARTSPLMASNRSYDTLNTTTHPLGPGGRSYLLSRGIDADLIDQLEHRHLLREGPKGYLAFPGYDPEGRLRCISQRAYDPTLHVARYDRKGSDKHWTYLLPGGVRPSTVIVVEGPIDALSVACMEHLKFGKGYFETTKLATCGASYSTVLQRLRRLQAKRVILAMDLDSAGRTMSSSLAGACQRARISTVAVCDGHGKDPNDWLRARRS